MEDIQQVITWCEDIHSAAVIKLEPDSTVFGRIDEALRQRQFFVARIRSKIRSDTELFHALYEACEFPKWFGFNWNAVNDSLGDFHWHLAPGYTIIFEQPLAVGDTSLGYFLDIIQTNKEIWERVDVSFNVLMPR